MTTTEIPVFKGNLIVRGKIEALTGLHIGGSKEKMQIGGVDLVVIRDPLTQYPYIPGSSLKGKLRHLLEYVTGGVNEPFNGQLGQVSVKKEIVRLFGIGAEVLELAHDEKALRDRKASIKDSDDNKAELLSYLENVAKLKTVGLPRLLVRDAMPDQATINKWDTMSTDSNYTEYKAENTIDRITSAANPRFIERVAAGSAFDFEIVYTAYGEAQQTVDLTGEQLKNDMVNMVAAMQLLEHAALGKAGSRGYGRIKFHMDTPHWIMAQDYLSGSDAFTAADQPMSEKELMDLSAFRTALLTTLKA